MIRSISKEVALASLGPNPDPLKVLSIAADKIKMMPFSFLDTLADLACQTSPMKVRGGRHTDDIALGIASTSNKRPRAYSESWVGQGGSIGWSSSDLDLKRDIHNNSPLLPQMLDHYAEIYNKNGRIGIYNREERDTIIERFREKKRKRVWKKKIRYHCRKNLADRRVRVKGRFVRRGVSGNPDDGAPSPSGDGSIEDDDVDDDGDSDVDDGTGDAATTSSGDITESGSKRSRKSSEHSTANRTKKSRRVLFDETVVDNSENGMTANPAVYAATDSNDIAAGVNAGIKQEGNEIENSSSRGGQRMRRHSIAY